MDILKELEKKYSSTNQSMDTYLQGLLHAKPITYWDYIDTDVLLNLQKPRTNFPDEMVFIMYHQVNEILFKMILWEMEQVHNTESITPDFFTEKLRRISRYFDMLSESFNVMTNGMEISQYMQFRNSLTPASGFQSAQYRLIEFGSTELINLIDFRFRATIDRNTPFEHAFEHLYWQAAGKDHKTGTKSVLIQEFEKKYKTEFINYMQKVNTTNLYTKYKALPENIKSNPELIAALRHYDYTVNVTWVMCHYKTAEKYLESGPKKAEATGGSEWKKYMHPKYQRRIFFPEVWSEDELKNWGENI
ncbi:MAG: tryptophan 2,3-dioxygenase [Flavobacteriia bacterium]|nr:tryptophan 2,3-dioxygenase [Flavobacteriia bacterium]